MWGRYGLLPSRHLLPVTDPGGEAVASVLAAIQRPSPPRPPATTLRAVALVTPPGGDPVAITGSDARARLFALIEQVTKDGVPMEIVTRSGTAVLISKDEYDALEETAHVLRSPANAARLMRSLADAEAGNVEPHGLVES